LSGVAL
jgi:hypothetical protein